MSDHIDGPRQIGDPSADLTDLSVFTSPENLARTVLAANVFPTCGVDAVFSNAIDHSIVVRRARVAGLGDATKFETSDPELRFSFRFDALERGRTRSPSSEAPASCLTVKRFALLRTRKTAHRRRMAPFACLPVCGPIPSSLRGCFAATR
jgi:hypothetical protein